MDVLLDMFLFISHSTVGKLVIERFELAGLHSAGISLEERRNFDLLLRLLELAFVGVTQFVLKKLFTVLEGFFVHLVVLLGLLEFNSRHLHFEDCLSG